MFRGAFPLEPLRVFGYGSALATKLGELKFPLPEAITTLVLVVSGRNNINIQKVNIFIKRFPRKYYLKLCEKFRKKKGSGKSFITLTTITTIKIITIITTMIIIEAIATI